jgi:hypothetical protein
VIHNSRHAFSVKVCLLFEQNTLITTEASVGSEVLEATGGSYYHSILQVTRPSVNGQVNTLINQMAQAILLWEAPRIHGELLKLGIDISERTVSRLMLKLKKPQSQTWRTVLDNHLREFVSIDFLTVPTASFRVLFVLVACARPASRAAFQCDTTSDSRLDNTTNHRGLPRRDCAPIPAERS